MTTPYEKLKTNLKANPRTWLITGVAGFIGSNLLETLLGLNQRVVGLDNFSTGYQKNIDEALKNCQLTPQPSPTNQSKAASSKLITDDCKLMTNITVDQADRMQKLPCAKRPFGPVAIRINPVPDNEPDSDACKFSSPQRRKYLIEIGIGIEIELSATISRSGAQTCYSSHPSPQARGGALPTKEANFVFIEGDIRNLETCRKAMVFSPSPIRGEGRVEGESYPVDYVLHQAALGSVPRSIEDPVNTNENNISGFLNMLVAARDAGVKRMVYAASSSTYGDHPALPKVEDTIGKPLSPYAVTKVVNELYADVFARTYNFKTIGLRYFNIFGQRQDPNGAYAAVIPKWFACLIKGATVYINGDGDTSRDFCFIDNCVQANLLAATTENEEATNQVYNIAFGEKTTLNQLYKMILENLTPNCQLTTVNLEYRSFRAGDVRHSLADISKAQRLIGYQPQFSIKAGLDKAAKWYLENLN